MDGWGGAPSEAEARTWLAMDLLAPVHGLWALEAVPGPGGEAPAAVQALTEGLLGEHRPELTEAALAGLVDLERALVVGAALEVARGLVAPEVLVAVECALVDEACRMSLLPLVNAAADLLLELERDAAQNEVAQDEAVQNEAAEQGGSLAPADVLADVLADALAPAAGDADTALTRGDATDDDNRPGEARAAACPPDPQGPSSSERAATGVGAPSEDVAHARRSCQPSERVATSPSIQRRRAVVRGTKRVASARPGAGRASRRHSRGRSRGPPCRPVSLPHGERRAHDARPGERQVVFGAGASLTRGPRVAGPTGVSTATERPATPVAGSAT